MAIPLARRRRCALATAVTMTALTAVAQQSITLKDYTARGFAPDVVNYSVKVKLREVAELRLTDAAGTSVPIQVSTPARNGVATLSFVTGLPLNGSVTYTLTTDGKAPAATGGVTVQPEGKEAAVMANAFMAVKVPAPQEKTFQDPVLAETLPAPILAFRSGPEPAWLGAGRVLSKLPVMAWRVTQPVTGPVYAETLYESTYAGGGFYRATIRVADQVPVAIVTEEYDLGRMCDTDETWELTLTQGWAPDTVEVAKTWGNGGVDTGRTMPFAEFKPLPIMSDGAYGNVISQAGLSRAAEAKAEPGQAVMAGIVPLHRGFWRRSQNIDLQAPAPGQLVARMLMARSPIRWQETSPFCVITHEPGKPPTWGRRQWGLVLGRPPQAVKGGTGGTEVGPFYQARLTYGVVGLDRYKDFILEWPDTKPDYPRAFMTKAELPQYLAVLTNEPLGPWLKDQYAFFNGKAETAKGSLTHALQGLTHTIGTAICCPAQSHHGTCDAQRHITAAEDALTWPGLPDTDRQRLRALLALTAYLFVDADTNSQGTGGHTGNPNMSMARQGWCAGAVAAVPDHPLYATWRDYLAEFIGYKLASNMAPGGGWFEPGTYHLWGYQRLLYGLTALEHMKAPNLDRLFTYHQADCDYYMNLILPFDSRYGARMIPGFGNSATHYSDSLMEMAGSLSNRAPAQAAQLAWAWQANGSMKLGSLPVLAKPWLQPKEPVLTSRFFPGFGVIFRAHQGPEETYMMLRSGYLWSHWTIDQGNVAIYSRGAALLPAQPYTYFTSKLPEFSQYNDLRFGHPANEFRYAWSDSNVLDYAFGKSVQYAWASAGYPAWFITPGVTPGFGDPPKLKEGVAQKEGAFWWNRQIAFMIGRTPKSPNYFLFHDTVGGEPGAGQGQGGRLAQWFNLDVIGRKDAVQVQGNRLGVKTEWPVGLDIVFADDRQLAPEMTEENQFLNIHYAAYGRTFADNIRGKPLSPNWFRADGKSVDPEKLVVPDQERRVLIRIPGEPGQDHFWLAYPLAAGEATPTVKRLGPNVVRISHPEGTDTVLLAPTADRFEDAEVLLEGQAAAVRVAVDGTATLAMLGGAGRVGYKGVVRESTVAFEQVLAPADSGKPGVQAVKGEGVAESAYRPRLKDHTVAAPGVRLAETDGIVEYLLEGSEPVSLHEGNVHLYARRAAVLVETGQTRFVVRDATFAQLTVGTRAVRGCGPFDITISDSAVSGTVDGRMRTLVTTCPARIVRPMYQLDGVRWHAGWPDDPAPWRGRDDAQFAIALGVTAGQHEVAITEAQSPTLPPIPARLQLGAGR